MEPLFAEKIIKIIVITLPSGLPATLCTLPRFWPVVSSELEGRLLLILRTTALQTRTFGVGINPRKRRQKLFDLHG
jgi:hypothetical protein